MKKKVLTEALFNRLAKEIYKHSGEPDIMRFMPESGYKLKGQVVYEWKVMKKKPKRPHC